MNQKVVEAIREAVSKLDTVYHVMDTIKLDGLVYQARLVGSGNEILTVKGILEQIIAQADADQKAPAQAPEGGKAKNGHNN